MKKKTFENFIKLSIDKGKREQVIYNNGLDLINFLNDYQAINSILLKSIYGEETSDIIFDFICDSIFDELEKNKDNYIIYSNDDEIIADCSTLDELYKYAESVRMKLISSNYSYEMKEPMSEEERLNIIEGLFSK